MTMDTPGVMPTPPALARCTWCRTQHEAEDLMLVRVDGQPRFAVCRPSVGRDGCFRNGTGPRAEQPIQPLADYLRGAPS